jgi:hypothetical protein
MRLFRVGREVQRGHGGVTSGWRARCGGVLSGGGAEVVLSEQFQLYEPWQRSEAVDEARPPRRVARFGGLR